MSVENPGRNWLRTLLSYLLSATLIMVLSAVGIALIIFVVFLVYGG